jgi:hypothetical protein
MGGHEMQPQSTSRTVCEMPPGLRYSGIVSLCVGLVACVQFADRISAVETATNGQEATITGIVIKKGDASITVRGDRDTEAIEYDLRGLRGGSREALKTISVTNRVELAYKRTGKSRELVTLRKLRPVAKETITGEVIHNHGWWIEVQPDHGPCEGFAVQSRLEKNGEVARYVSGLREFDIVTIRFVTNATGHRIESIWKIGSVKREKNAAIATSFRQRPDQESAAELDELPDSD